MVTSTKPTGYLGGPIANCDDEQAHEWRNFVTQKTGVHWRNPMIRDFREYGINNKTVEKTIGPDIVKYIIESDKADIDASDICLFNCWKPSFGTPMEIIYAWEQKKNNIIVIPKGVTRSPWLRYHATIVVPTVEDAVDYINENW